MIPQDFRLVTLLRLVDQSPSPVAPAKPKRGRPYVYGDPLFLKILVIMLVKHLTTVHEVLTVLAEVTPELVAVRTYLEEAGPLPHRKTLQRRLKTLPTSLPDRIACLGTHLVNLLDPWLTQGPAAAIDSTVLRAHGGVWHQKDREQGVVPHTAIDTDAHWTKSGWHGWVYGWKLHIVITASGHVWIPLAAELTPANEADNVVAVRLLDALPAAVGYILGDRHYNTPEIQEHCEEAGRTLVATHYGKYPHTDPGSVVRKEFHKLRSATIETFNELFKTLFDGHRSVPTKGLLATQRFVLGAVFLFQLILWDRFRQGLDLRKGLKAYLKAA